MEPPKTTPRYRISPIRGTRRSDPSAEQLSANTVLVVSHRHELPAFPPRVWLWVTPAHLTCSSSLFQVFVSVWTFSKQIFYEKPRFISAP